MNNIEILEELKARLKLYKKSTDVQFTFTKSDIQAIENLIKENKELKIISNAIKVLETNAVSDDTYYVIARKNFLNGSYARLLDDYIPKSKIKELLEHYKNTGYNELEEVLQELLEGE